MKHRRAGHDVSSSPGEMVPRTGAAEAKVTAGVAFAYATSSATDFTGTLAFTTSTFTYDTMGVTGVKSLSGS